MKRSFPQEVLDAGARLREAEKEYSRISDLYVSAASQLVDLPEYRIELYEEIQALRIKLEDARERSQRLGQEFKSVFDKFMKSKL